MENSYKKISALILCAGQGLRSKLQYNKIFHMFGTKTILEMTLDSVCNSNVTEIILVVSPHDEQRINDIVSNKYPIKICQGGKTRAESVRNGLNFIKHSDIVVIHDCARPFVSPALINSCIFSALSFGSGIAAVKSTDALKKVENGIIVSNIDRETAYNIQTPQAFEYNSIRTAYNASLENVIDDSEAYALAGFAPRIVEGSYDNIKITSPNDLYGITSGRLKIGVGFDVHQTLDGRKLILGGEDIPSTKGLIGHSDADVLIHAIMDALLSAAGLPDIGVQFPNTEMQYKDISSMKLLQEIKTLIKKQGLVVRNISSVIIAEKPKLSPFIQKIRYNLSTALEIDIEQINISATTAETLGLIGEEKGIAASSVCLLENVNQNYS